MTASKLFSSLSLNSTAQENALVLRNRIFSTGHQTYLAKGGEPTKEMAAYHEARAIGGAGLIVTEAARVHQTSMNSAPVIAAHDPKCIDGYSRIAELVRQQGCAIFGQLSHPGRVSNYMEGGLRGVPYSASATPDDRFHTIPREMSQDLIEDIITGYGLAAHHMTSAGFQGIEIAASHGLLPAQFLNENVNRREDDYGGNFENRLRFLRHILKEVRRNIGKSTILGIRISADEDDIYGIEQNTSIEICKALAREHLVDYINTTMGTMASWSGSVHVVPPMQVEHGYVAPHSQRLKETIDLPVFVAGRVNQPQMAEQILDKGQADMIGMTRAMIADPDIANKALAGKADDIRACIGCNQACIGHYHMGYSISCIQHPETGRELQFKDFKTTKTPRKVAIIGGGPAGMKAAIYAAKSGHSVDLYEANSQLGGQAKLAQLLPDRSEFGGLITNLETELSHYNIAIHKNSPMTRALLDKERPDHIIVATGALPTLPEFDGCDQDNVYDSWDVISGATKTGQSVLVSDWRCDWTGVGTAEKLAREGCHVRLAVNGLHAGQNLQPYLRDHWIGRLHKLGVEIIPYARLYGFDDSTAYFVHGASGEAIICDDVDSLVLCLAPRANGELEQSLKGFDGTISYAGDCLSPRSAEEAIYEGMIAALSIS